MELDLNEKMELIRDCLTCNGSGLYKDTKDTTFCHMCCFKETKIQYKLDRFKQYLIELNKKK